MIWGPILAALRGAVVTMTPARGAAMSAAKEFGVRQTFASRAMGQFQSTEAAIMRRAGPTPLLPHEKAQIQALREQAHFSNLAAMKAHRHAEELKKVADQVDTATENEERLRRNMVLTAAATPLVTRFLKFLPEFLSTKFVGGLKTAIDILHSAAAPVEALVRIHNPAKAQLFMVAINNAYGVIGRMLTPIMDAFTRSARKLGDLLAGMEPVVAPLIRAIANLIDTVGTRWMDMVKEHGGGLQFMVDVLVTVAQNAMAAAHGVLILADALYKLIQSTPIGRLTGFGGAMSRFDPNRTAFGAAGQQARFVGAKAVSDEAIKAAMMQGVVQKSPELTELESIHQTIRNILQIAMNPQRGVQNVGAQGAWAMAKGDIPSLNPWSLLRLITGRRGM